MMISDIQEVDPVCESEALDIYVYLVIPRQLISLPANTRTRLSLKFSMSPRGAEVSKNLSSRVPDLDF